MADLIDRQAALDALEWKWAGKAAIDAIKELPSAQPEQEEFEWCHDCKEYDQQEHCCHRWTKVIRQTVAEIKDAQPEQRWIPCSERLPEKKQDVIVSVNNGPIYTDTDEWTGTGFWAHGYDVIAWMPLPEPWRGE